MTNILIGLTGRKRAGKDTVANIIEELVSTDSYKLKLKNAGLELIVERVAFADAVRTTCADLFGIPLEMFLADSMKDEDCLDRQIPGSKLDTDSPRKLLISYSEYMKQICGPDIWVTALKKRFLDLSNLGANQIRLILVTDVRFHAESRFLLRDAYAGTEPVATKIIQVSNQRLPELPNRNTLPESERYFDELGHTAIIHNDYDMAHLRYATWANLFAVLNFAGMPSPEIPTPLQNDKLAR